MRLHRITQEANEHELTQVISVLCQTLAGYPEPQPFDQCMPKFKDDCVMIAKGLLKLYKISRRPTGE